MRGTPFPGIQLGIVVAAYPQGNAVDVLLPDSGSRLTNVQVQVSSGSDSSGTVDLPDPGIPLDDNRWNLPGNPERNIIAVIQSYKGNPVCTGFILPQVCQMTFDRPNFRVFRHASDVYSTIDADGNTELFHPSGTFFRIGTDAGHEDLTGLDFDALWAIAKNTDKQVFVNLVIANGGQVKATFKIDPSGNVTVTAVGTLTADVTGDINVTTQGDLNATATGTIKCRASLIDLNGVTIDADGNVITPANLAVGTGASGTYTSPTGDVVTVQDGITTNII
jgi:hypothetical protein